MSAVGHESTRQWPPRDKWAKSGQLPIIPEDRGSARRRVRLLMSCAGCGFELLAEFAFCPRCGRPKELESPKPAWDTRDRQTDADRRQVTVLFADLCGFTSLSERLDPEEVRAFQTALFQSLGQAITRYGGFVAKYLGDAVLALFGAPVASEDDPQRALEATLDMLRRCSALNDRWAARLGQPVAL